MLRVLKVPSKHSCPYEDPSRERTMREIRTRMTVDQYYAVQSRASDAVTSVVS